MSLGKKTPTMAAAAVETSTSAVRGASARGAASPPCCRSSAPSSPTPTGTASPPSRPHLCSVVRFKKTPGIHHQSWSVLSTLCEKLSDELVVCKMEQIQKQELIDDDLEQIQRQESTNDLHTPRCRMMESVTSNITMSLGGQSYDDNMPLMHSFGCLGMYI
uniref:Uncharacterized protein n=1 Tax=Oryza brachyantha TaxID=4533 RepID=J3N156_ORYBR